MSLSGQVKSLFIAKVENALTRQIVYPVGAGVAAVSDNAAAAWAWSAYVQIVAAVADPCWLTGIHFHTNAVETFYGDIAIASGAAGFEVDLAYIPVRSLIVGATAMLAATWTDLPIMLAKPIKIIGGPRLAVAIRKSTVASLAGGVLKVICLTGYGA